MKYDTLKALVNAKVYENTEQRITGGDMNDVLQSAIASLGAHYQMGDLVSPADQITVGDEPVVFLATTPGTYTYFGGLVVADGEVALLVWSGTAWSKQTPDIATRTEVSQLGQETDKKIQKGELIISDGAIQSNTWVLSTDTLFRKHLVIPVFDGQAITDFSRESGLTTLYFALLTSYDTPVSAATPNFVTGYEGRQSVITSSLPYQIPEGAKYLIVNITDPTEILSELKIDGVDVLRGAWSIVNSLKQDIQDINQELDTCVNDSDLSIEITSDNIAEKTEVQYGDNGGNGIIKNHLIGSTGSISETTSYDLYRLHVSPGEIYTIGGFQLGGNGGSRALRIAWYNNSTLVSVDTSTYFNPNIREYPATLTVPAGANLLYFWIRSDKSSIPTGWLTPWDELQINKGAAFLPYDTFKQSITKINNYPLSVGDVTHEEFDELEQRVSTLEKSVLQDIIADLPVSDGSDIEIGYAHIDSTSGVVKVKMS